MSAEVPTKLLDGRVALVTGGGSGIGRETCRVFAREGAKVAVVDINEAGINETLELLKPADCKGFVADVTSSIAVNAMLTDVKAHFSGVPSILVNCAGIVRSDSILDVTEEDFDDVIRVNIKGTFLPTQALCRMMVENKVNHGSIVIISSINAIAPPPLYCAYSVSKGGLLTLTKAAAKEMGKHGIRINAILPGLTETPFIEFLSEREKADVVACGILQRLAKPEEIAEACLFLASDRSSFITGTDLKVSGGLFE